LTMPVTIINGADDQIADVGRQSARLHAELTGSEFIVLRGLGHMIHHLAPDAVADAIDRTAQQSSRVWALCARRIRDVRRAGVVSSYPDFLTLVIHGLSLEREQPNRPRLLLHLKDDLAPAMA
jgi:hypothetical protein